MATKSRHLKTEMQLWVADQRKAGGYTSADLAKWTGVTVDTARGWESRGRPSEEAITELERRFGRPAPRGSDEPVGSDALIAALQAQTAAISALVGLLAAADLPARVAALEPVVSRLAERVLAEPPMPTVPQRTTG